MTQLLTNLYGLRRIDESDPRWSRVDYYQETTGSAGADVNSAVLEPPTDKIWFITGVYALTTGAVGVTPVAVRVRAVNNRTPGTTIFMIAAVRFNPFLAAATTGILSQKVDALIIGGETGIRFTFGYDAGDVGNIQHLGFNGYEVPKGNILI